MVFKQHLVEQHLIDMNTDRFQVDLQHVTSIHISEQWGIEIYATTSKHKGVKRGSDEDLISV